MGTDRGNMGTARDGKVSKNFGTKDNKIKARFSDERQARRVAVLMKYMEYAYIDGMTTDQIADEVLQADFAKAREIIEKLEQRSEQTKGVNHEA